MIENSPVFKQLLKQLQQVPYLASKNVYHVIEHFLMLDASKMDQFCAALQEAKKQIVQCERCCTWKEAKAACAFCDSPKRDHALICVVETWQELIVIEKTEGYKGLYHVLGGVLNPLEGIGPSDLSIDRLIERVTTMNTLKEIILATNQTPEGEATAAFIAQRLKQSSVTVSCLARGVPVGSHLRFMDRVTVYKALSERRPF